MTPEYPVRALGRVSGHFRDFRDHGSASADSGSAGKHSVEELRSE
jgi:hypothetical protein